MEIPIEFQHLFSLQGDPCLWKSSAPALMKTRSPLVSLSLSLANILPEPHLTRLGTASSQGLLTWTSPLCSNTDKKNPAQQILLITSDFFLPAVFFLCYFPQTCGTAPEQRLL